MKYLVFDLETQTTTAYKRKASCFEPTNYVVARGWKKQGDTKNSWEYFPEFNRTSQLEIPDDVDMLVGFNLKFDLLWEMAQGNTVLHSFFKRGGRIWDGQYAEYLLQGQTQASQMCSLDSIIESYGGRLKIDEVKIMWEAGIQTSDIPEDLLIDYLVGTEQEQRNGGDIRNTELVFLGQIRKAVQQGQVKMIQDRMDGLLATIDMEFRGLKIDVQEAGKRLQVLQGQLAALDQELAGHLPELPFEFRWTPGQVSCLIFGGTVKYKLQTTYLDEETGELARLKATADWPLVNGEPMHPDTFTHDQENSPLPVEQDKFLSGMRKGELKYKKVPVPGELKVKYQDFFYTLPRITEPSPEWELARTDGDDGKLYSTSSDIIVELGLRNIPFLKAYAAKQKLDKEIGTYYVRIDPKKGPTGMLTCVQIIDHIIHHKLKHSSTVTTRLSSAEPNLQNLPRAGDSEVKRMFISRFGDDGWMLEVDYSQLEVVIQGVLSGDEALCQDLRDRIDFHCKRVGKKFSITYEEALEWCKNEAGPDYKAGKKERTKCKIFSFQRAYGAGAATIADETDMPLEDVQAMMEAEDLMYPGVVKFNADVESAVMRSAVPFQAMSDDGTYKTYRRGKWVSPTGTIYTWRSWDAPAFLQKRGQRDSFSPPELKNYPVQGLGGEVVQAMCGKLWRHFVSCDYYGWRAYLVNTVHDCVWTDCHRDVRDEVAADMKRIMESIPEFYNERHGMNITVPFPVEVETGRNMYDLWHWHAGEWEKRAA